MSLRGRGAQTNKVITNESIGKKLTQDQKGLGSAEKEPVELAEPKNFLMPNEKLCQIDDESFVDLDN